MDLSEPSRTLIANYDWLTDWVTDIPSLWEALASKKYLGSVKKLCDPLRGGGGWHQKDHKISQGGRGDHKKITEDHNHKGGVNIWPY